MMKRLLLSVLVSVCPSSLLAVEGADREQGAPPVTASAETFDRWLGMGQNGRDLAAMVEHLHARIAGGRAGQGLDQALRSADQRYARQGGADDVQKALLYNGREAREGLREAHAVLADYAQKLGLSMRLAKEADGRLMGVFAKQADATQRLRAASAEAGRFAAGMESQPPRSTGGDRDAGQLSSIEPQEQELAEVTQKVELAKDALADLEGRLDGMDALRERIKGHAEKAGLLDRGAGQALSASLTGRGGAAPAGSSKEILTDAMATLEKAVTLGKKSRGIAAALVERTATGAQKGREAERALAEAKGEAARALEAADRNHQEIGSAVRPGWEAAQPEEKPRFEARAAALKAETEGAAGRAAGAAGPAAASAAAAKAAGSTCPCAKGKAEKAVGDTGKLAALEKLGSLTLQTAARDGDAPAGVAERRVDTQRMRSLLGNSSFDGRAARAR